MVSARLQIEFKCSAPLPWDADHMLNEIDETYGCVI